MTTHILVVEDDKSLLEGIRDLLLLEGYDVTTAPHGEAALLKLATSSIPDLIVSDISMPKVDGFELLSQVRANPEWVTIPFIFLSARGEKQDIHRGIVEGVEDYVTKPFDGDVLVARIEASLRRQRQIIEAGESHIETLKRQILTMLNHEFRTPLSFIVAYADMMAQTPEFEHATELQRYVDGIQKGTDRLYRLIENFLILVELESGKSITFYERRLALVSDIEQIVEEAIEHEQDFIDRHKAIVDIYIEHSLRPFPADPTYLVTALGHLINNAVKFSPPESVVEVEVAPYEEGYICIAVRDYGRGIPLVDQERIFDTLYQSEREQYEQQGAGVGLAIVRHIMRLHDGRVTVDSEPGVGSTFRLILPTTAVT